MRIPRRLLHGGLVSIQIGASAPIIQAVAAPGFPLSLCCARPLCPLCAPRSPCPARLFRRFASAAPFGGCARFALVSAPGGAARLAPRCCAVSRASSLAPRRFSPPALLCAGGGGAGGSRAAPRICISIPQSASQTAPFTQGTCSVYLSIEKGRCHAIDRPMIQSARHCQSVKPSSINSLRIALNCLETCEYLRGMSGIVSRWSMPMERNAGAAERPGRCGKVCGYPVRNSV